MKKIISIIIPVLFIAVGALKLIDQVDIFRKLKTEDLWGQATGLVTKSQVVNDYERSPFLKKANFIKRNNPYQIEIQYEFFKGVELVRGTKILNADRNFPTEQAARIQAQKYHLGKKVEVFYLKSDPTFALLDLSLNKNFWQTTAIFVIILLVGLAALKNAFKG